MAKKTEIGRQLQRELSFRRVSNICQSSETAMIDSPALARIDTCHHHYLSSEHTDDHEDAPILMGSDLPSEMQVCSIVSS